jgi:hypothetical protein
MMDHVPTKVDIPNTLLELRELSDLGRSLANIGDLFRPRYLDDLLDPLGGFAELRKWTSDKWLAYQFGVRPVISDVLKALGTSARVSKRIAYLRKTYGKRTKFRRNLVTTQRSDPRSGVYATDDYGGVYPYGDILGRIEYRMSWTYVTTSYCGGYSFQKLQGLDDSDALYKAYLKDLGFANLQRTAWNALPWTFLVDYFTNIGDLISQLPSPVFEGEILLQDCWHASKSVFESQILYEVVTYPPYGGSTIRGPSGVASTCTETRFARGVGIPTSIGLRFDTDLSPTQVANIVALIGQL